MSTPVPPSPPQPYATGYYGYQPMPAPEPKNGFAMTWFGSIISALVVAAGIWGMVIVLTAVDDLDNDLHCIDQAKTAKQINAC